MNNDINSQFEEINIRKLRNGKTEQERLIQCEELSVKLDRQRIEFAGRLERTSRRVKHLTIAFSLSTLAVIILLTFLLLHM